MCVPLKQNTSFKGIFHSLCHIVTTIGFCLTARDTSSVSGVLLTKANANDR